MAHVERAKPPHQLFPPLSKKMGVGTKHIQANATGDLAQWCSKRTHLAEASGLLPVLKNVGKVEQKLLQSSGIRSHQESDLPSKWAQSGAINNYLGHQAWISRKTMMCGWVHSSVWTLTLNNIFCLSTTPFETFRDFIHDLSELNYKVGHILSLVLHVLNEKGQYFSRILKPSSASISCS